MVFTERNLLNCPFQNEDEQKPRGRKWRRERMLGKKIGNCEVRHKLNKGGTSMLYACVMNGRDRICKITDGKYTDTLWKEYETLRKLKHPNIVEVFDCIDCNRIVAMAMEPITKGDLHDFIIKKWPIHADRRRKFATQILSAVECIHCLDIAHCDIKLENILITNDDDLKLIDFGSALYVKEATFDDFAYIATTPEYLPPEIICASANEGYDIRAIDEWSVGVVLFILLTGRFPFGEVDQNKIAKYIKKMRSATSFELKQKEEGLIYFERDYLAMLRGLLCFDHERRSPVCKVLKMPYFETMTMTPLEEVLDEIDADFEGIFDM